MSDSETIRPDSGPKPKFLRSDLINTEFYRAHEAEILAAQKDGRIIDDVSEARHGTKEKPRWGKPFGKVPQ
jgi:hypothetical protein